MGLSVRSPFIQCLDRRVGAKVLTRLRCGEP